MIWEVPYLNVWLVNTKPSEIHTWPWLWDIEQLSLAQLPKFSIEVIYDLEEKFAQNSLAWMAVLPSIGCWAVGYVKPSWSCHYRSTSRGQEVSASLGGTNVPLNISFHICSQDCSKEFEINQIVPAVVELHWVEDFGFPAGPEMRITLCGCTSTGQDGSIELGMEFLSPEVVELQYLPNRNANLSIGCGIRASERIWVPMVNAWMGFDRPMIKSFHIYRPKQLCRNWDLTNWSSSCRVPAFARIWVHNGITQKGLMGQLLYYYTSTDQNSSLELEMEWLSL